MRNYCITELYPKNNGEVTFCDLAVVFAFSFNEYHRSFNFGITYLRYYPDNDSDNV